MRIKRNLLIVILIVVAVLLFYNFYLAPVFVEDYYRMGMHEGMSWRNSNRNVIDFRSVFPLLLAVTIIGLIGFVSPFNSSNKCAKCGFIINNKNWNICPHCGTRIKR